MQKKKELKNKRTNKITQKKQKEKDKKKREQNVQHKEKVGLMPLVFIIREQNVQQKVPYSIITKIKCYLNKFFNIMKFCYWCSLVFLELPVAFITSSQITDV